MMTEMLYPCDEFLDEIIKFIYSKVKSKMKPSEYCKQVLKMHEVKSQGFVSEYFISTEELVCVINEYKRLANIPKDEMCLADLIV